MAFSTFRRYFCCDVGQSKAEEDESMRLSNDDSAADCQRDCIYNPLQEMVLIQLIVLLT